MMLRQRCARDECVAPTEAVRARVCVCVPGIVEGARPQRCHTCTLSPPTTYHAIHKQRTPLSFLAVFSSVPAWLGGLATFPASASLASFWGHVS
ncbi:hypothetical protein E2C01_058329 [Portunus trituberculatus]|uniref:Uncharacterized protein n=1 Tax=Portunus trituberculatus TaxID=210409 RepID=A0A5B7H520_PORTR|nr:hypothetical protein [Portunus trituberculatus]